VAAVARRLHVGNRSTAASARVMQQSKQHKPCIWPQCHHIQLVTIFMFLLPQTLLCYGEIADLPVIDARVLVKGHRVTCPTASVGAHRWARCKRGWRIEWQGGPCTPPGFPCSYHARRKHRLWYSSCHRRMRCFEAAGRVVWYNFLWQQQEPRLEWRGAKGCMAGAASRCIAVNCSWNFPSVVHAVGRYAIAFNQY
jgi:hypothetical protein